MAKRSKIEWLRGGGSWNPWYCCTEISAGCRNCYARAWAKRCGRPWKVTQAKPGTLNAPLHWAEGRMVFVCSLSDFWHPAADAWRAAAWDIIKACPQHTFLLCTKRPDRIHVGLPAGGIPANCWLGVTVENQEEIWRVSSMLQHDATVHWVSCEPLVGPVEIGKLIPWLEWCVIGGESGPKCRPMECQWARDVVDGCTCHMVPVFLKQLGGYPDPRGGAMAKLDGRLYKEFPDVT